MRRQHLRGFALTEVLVASALFAISLLGHLALLVHGLRTERDAAYLAAASALTADIAERIRANPAAVNAYALDPADPLSPAPACAIGAPFDAAERAACDIEEWLNEVARALPGAKAQLVVNPLPGTATAACVITIRWTPPGSGAIDYVLRLQV